ncbi:hypothetical protein EVAR_64764_1 [Eumeta japonica]|uniref:Uncharacterized protein n=1 Tax=Eumeta variegata TaxID=151549 RepID=A0A4C1ZA62_EUMVA|nr:hypothetical protein EVAR_64764_1 [Eumeta japonica]
MAEYALSEWTAGTDGLTCPPKQRANCFYLAETKNLSIDLPVFRIELFNHSAPRRRPRPPSAVPTHILLSKRSLNSSVVCAVWAGALCVGVSRAAGALVAARRRTPRLCALLGGLLLPLACLFTSFATQLHQILLSYGCGWESLMKSVTLGNVTMSHRTREPAECLRLSHSTMIGLPRAALEN